MSLRGRRWATCLNARPKLVVNEPTLVQADVEADVCDRAVGVAQQRGGAPRAGGSGRYWCGVSPNDAPELAAEVRVRARGEQARERAAGAHALSGPWRGGDGGPEDGDHRFECAIGFYFLTERCQGLPLGRKADPGFDPLSASWEPATESGGCAHSSEWHA